MINTLFKLTCPTSCLLCDVKINELGKDWKRGFQPLFIDCPKKGKYESLTLLGGLMTAGGVCILLNYNHVIEGSGPLIDQILNCYGWDW